jgi:SAM-dependent methyltransferase
VRSYEDLVAEALAAPVNGQDLTYLDGRMTEAGPPWSYRERAGEVTGQADGPVLDMTGAVAESAGGLPFPDGEFAVVLNRHQPYDPSEVRRVLRGDGVFLTEQVGGLDGLAINEALGAPLPSDFSDWALNTARTGLEAAGLRVANGRTAFPERLFHDVGALVYFLRATPRQVPDFSIERYDKELRLLHDQMSASEPFRDRAVRFLIEAVPA